MATAGLRQTGCLAMGRGAFHFFAIIRNHWIISRNTLILIRDTTTVTKIRSYLCRTHGDRILSLSSLCLQQYGVVSASPQLTPTLLHPTAQLLKKCQSWRFFCRMALTSTNQKQRNLDTRFLRIGPVSCILLSLLLLSPRHRQRHSPCGSSAVR